MKREKVGYLYLLLVFMIWGSLYVVSKFVLGKLPVFTISFLRFLIAGIPMGLVLWKKKPAKIQKQDYRYVLLLGVVGYFLTVGAQLIGTQLAGVSVASLVNSLNPMVIMFAAAVFLKEKLNWQKVTGVAVSLTGIYLIIRQLQKGMFIYTTENKGRQNASNDSAIDCQPALPYSNHFEKVATVDIPFKYYIVYSCTDNRDRDCN